MPRSMHIRFMLPLSLILLSGCETLAPRVEGENLPAWQARRAELQGIAEWTLDGRLAIRAGQEGQTANVIWKQEGAYFDARFFGPFGAGNTRIIGNADELILETSDGDQLFTSNPERDLFWELGWTVPLEQMPYWVLGLPGPGLVEDLVIDGAGRLQSLRQGAWALEIQQYRQREDGRVMPLKINLTREGVRIRLIVDEWTLPAANEAMTSTPVEGS